MTLRRIYYLSFLIFSLCSTLVGQRDIFSLEEVRKILSPDFNFNQISLDSGLVLLDQAAATCLESGDTCLLVQVLSERAMQLSTTSRQQEALLNVQSAHELLMLSQCDRRLEIFIDEARVAIKEGTIDPKGRSDLAIGMLKKYRKDPYDSATYMRFVFSTCCESCDSSIALQYHDTLYDYALRNKDAVMQQKVFINKGAIYAWSGDFDKAKEYFAKAVKFKSDPAQMSHLGTLYNNMAGLSDDPEEVLMYIDSAIYYAKITNDLDELHTYTENKALYYRMIGDYKNAYVSIYDASVLKDSLLNQEKILALAEMQEKFEAEKKSNEIKDLKLVNLQAESRFQRNRNRLLGGLFLLISLAGFLATRYYISNKHRKELRSKNIELSTAHERSDNLLLNILPAEVAEELKSTGQADAKMYDLATIMFTDFIDFTKEVAQFSSEELLEELNFYFRAFDTIIEKYKIEKIKTIGDSYMAVGGLPIPYSDSTRNTVLAALEMQEVVKQRSLMKRDPQKPGFEMRIGVHTGPIVAGIVGVKKFQYDVWGDAVNTASRLENTGEAGMVNISQSTYDLIKDDPQFEFTSRGQIEAKGKGKIDMYFVAKS